MVVLGIDPGAKGALAWVTGDGHLIDVEDMPMSTVRDKLRVSAAGLALAFRARRPDLVVIEGVGAMPGQGVSSCFSFGYSAGLIEGAAAGLGLPVEIVYAAAWKRRAGVPKDKGAARQMATRFWPGAADKFKRVRDDGRAEAALLARWAVLRSDGPSAPHKRTAKPLGIFA
jgi:crossover junction endodeoxyribonuclease RuvC